MNAWRGPYLGVGKRNTSTWQPFQALTFVTPPFPGYVSGHASFSAAAAEVSPDCRRSGRSPGSGMPHPWPAWAACAAVMSAVNLTT